MSDTDLIKLYSQKILALAADMPLTDPLADPQAKVQKRAPLCGSSVTVALSTDQGKVSAYAQDVKACALGQAAASVLGRVVIGRDLSELRGARDALQAMLAENGPVPPAPFDGFEVLTAARDFPNRHGSILLALDATVEALDQIEASKSA